MSLLLAAVLACQEESLQTLMARWGDDDPSRRDDASRRIVARWKEWKDEDLTRLRTLAEGNDTELAGRAKDAFAAIRLRRRLGAPLLEKLPDASELVLRGTADRRLTLLVRATELWEKGELKEESLRGLAEAAADSGWTLDGHALLEHVFNRDVKAYTPLVVPFLRHSDPELRGTAARRIGRLGAREHADAVARLLDDHDSFVRESAVVCLGHLRATEHYPKLVPLLKAGGEFAEVAAVVLACAEARSVAPLVAARLSEPDEADRLVALSVLGRMGAMEYVPRMAEFLRDSSPAARRSAVTTLGWMAAAEKTEQLLPFLTDSDVFTRTETVRALGRTGRSELIPKLVPLLKEGGNEIAWTTAQAILDLGLKDHAKAVAELLQEPSGTALAMALYLLGQVRASGYAKDARRLLDHHQPMVRAEAAKALALLDPSGCIRDLVPLLEDQFEAVRMDAALALSRAPVGGLPAAEREALVKTLAQAKDSYSGNARAAAAVAWLNAASPGRDAQHDVIQMIQANFSDPVADAALDWLERVHEPEVHQKLNRELSLEKAIETMDGVIRVLEGSGVRLEFVEILNLYARVPAGLRTTPRRLLTRLWEGSRPVVRKGKVRVVPATVAVMSWETWLSK